MEPGILTTTLNSFLTVFSHAWGNLHGSINFLTKIFLGLEVVMMGLWMALGGMENLASVMKKMLYLMVWLWIVNNFPMLAHAFVTSMIQAGQTAGGGTGGNVFDPSAVLSIGMNTVATAQEEISQAGVMNIANIGDIILIEICLLLIVIAYMVIAWQIFYAVLEFYLIAALVGLFMPFGFFEPTKFLAEKGIGAVVSSGIKLMVLAFILAVIVPVLNTIHFSSGDLTFREVLSALLISGSLAFLTIQAPGVAAGLMAGSPSLTLGGAVQNAAVGAGAAALTAYGMASAGGAIAKGVGAAATAHRGGGEVAAASSMSGAGSAPPPASPVSAASSGPVYASSGSASGSAGVDHSSEWARKALDAHALQTPNEGNTGGGVQVKL